MAPLLTETQLEKRIDAVNEAVRRARSALFFCILAAGTMFICLWNTYASWDRDFAFLDPQSFGSSLSEKEMERFLDKDFITRSNCSSTGQNTGLECMVSEGAERGVAAMARQAAERFRAWEVYAGSLPPKLLEQQMRSWVDTQVVSIGLLGIKISVSDFAILGSLSLGLLTYYMFLCGRRENHEIGYLFQDMNELVAANNDSLSDALKAQAYHAFSMVASFMVFNLSGDHRAGGKTDGFIDSLKRPSPARHIPGIRFASGLLYFLPLVVILCTMCCDSGWLHVSNGHLFFVSPFRLHPDGVKPGPLEDKYFYFAEGFATIVAAAVAAMSVKVRQYENATRKVLEEFFHTVLVAKCGVKERWRLDEEVRQDSATR